jgi:flagellar FliJ protein
MTMSKNKTFSLQPLVQLTQQLNDAATRRFGQLNQQQLAAQTKLDTLLQYRKDYQERFQEAARNGMSQADMRNFQDFMHRLDEVIAQQRSANEQALNSVQAGRNELQDTQRKLKSFDALAQRHVENERKLTARSEQRQQDEQSGRHAALKTAAHKDK